MSINLISSRLLRLTSNQRGNVLMVMGFALVPLTFATGMAIDYARAARLQTKLNAVADAAALAAVTTPMMNRSSAEGCAAARRMFENQITGIDGLVIDTTKPAQLTIDVTDNASVGSCSSTRSFTTDSYARTATVTWTALSQNSFAAILGMRTISIGGSSQSKASVAPNIDFYVLLDTSGSMALPVTSAGIATLKTATGGCAFACHSVVPEGNGEGFAYDQNGRYVDYYAVARSYGLKLRIDEEGIATRSMMSVAKQAMNTNKAQYQMSISRFAEKGGYAGRSWANIFPLSTDLDAAGAKAATVQTSLYYVNNWAEQNRWNNDTDTASSEAFDKMNALMPDPGGGGAGQKPQEVMLVVTDGLRDESRGDGKPEVTFDLAKCDSIKQRGIRIALLYTEYLPETINNLGWAVNAWEGNVLNRLPLIEPTLQACASPGLYYKVTSDDDISAALAKLFQQTVATAHLTQ